MLLKSTLKLQQEQNTLTVTVPSCFPPCLDYLFFYHPSIMLWNLLYVIIIQIYYASLSLAEVVRYNVIHSPLICVCFKKSLPHTHVYIQLKVSTYSGSSSKYPILHAHTFFHCTESSVLMTCIISIYRAKSWDIASFSLLY